MAETKESLKVKFDEKAVPGNTQVIHLDPVGSSGTDLSGGILNEEYLVGLTGREV